MFYSTFADETLHLGYYLDPAGRDQLYDDGRSFGDAAIDNRYTYNDIYYSGQGEAQERDLPYEFSVRFNLVAENHITSYDVYPFFMVNEVSAVDEIENEGLRIYPTVLNNKNRTINVEIDFPYSKASWKIFAMNGKELMSSSELEDLKIINIENFPNGIYAILFQIDNKIIAKNIVVRG